jgi:hypothetical protein
MVKFMNWFKITLKDAAVASGAIKTVMDAFESAMPVGDDSKDCVLFSRDEPDSTVIFVSPGFAAVAPKLVERFSGIECIAPPPRQAGEEFGTSLLLASHSNYAWSLLV